MESSQEIYHFPIIVLWANKRKTLFNLTYNNVFYLPSIHISCRIRYNCSIDVVIKTLTQNSYTFYFEKKCSHFENEINRTVLKNVVPNNNICLFYDSLLMKYEY